MYNDMVVKEVFKNEYPDLSYAAEERFSDDEICSLGIFSRKKVINGNHFQYLFNGSDLINGEIDGKAFRACNVNIRRKSKLNGSENKISCIFNGIMAEYMLGSHFDGSLLIIAMDNLNELDSSYKDSTVLSKLINAKRESMFEDVCDSSLAPVEIFTEGDPLS